MLLILIVLLLIVTFWVLGHSEYHLNRNKHNKLPIGNLTLLEKNIYKDEAGLHWELQPHIKNKFHQPDEEVQMVENAYPNVEGEIEFDTKNPNLKFLSKLKNGGSYEAILQPDGTYLTTGLKQGTYNYGHPDGLWGSLKHTFLDVIPHFVNSNYK